MKTGRGEPGVTKNSTSTEVERKMELQRVCSLADGVDRKKRCVGDVEGIIPDYSTETGQWFVESEKTGKERVKAKTGGRKKRSQHGVIKPETME